MLILTEVKASDSSLVKAYTNFDGVLSGQHDVLVDI